jgi:acetylornithine deacetylase/succinyl-diaminopimelate desuccinylase-like protein
VDSRPYEFRQRALTYAAVRHAQFLAELKDFVRFPTVSAQPRHAGDLKRCAQWLARHLRRIGLKRVNVIPTRSHPLVYAEWLHAPSRPTVLIYGHYDVQPAEPLDEWRSPPFAPTVRGENLYGRGACDDKGQLFTHVKALEAYLQTGGSLPVNVKCLFEGEEEIGSPNLAPFIRRHARALAADLAVASDTQMLGPDRPALTYALRGGLSMEVETRGQQTDLHSGTFGGCVHNPLQALCEIVAALHDTNGRIAVPNFYDRVRRWPEAERAYMARTGPDDGQVLADAKAWTGWGEPGFSLYERTTIRPSLSVTGVVGGYQGLGVKAVIPARAVAKLNFRLVPDQRPEEIERLVRQHVARLTPPTMELTIRTFLKASPALVGRSHPALRAAAAAYRHGFGAWPVLLRSGGTIPVVNTLREVLYIPTVLMGFALPDAHIHAPNERFHLPTFYRGIKTAIRFLWEVGAGLKQKDAPSLRRTAQAVATRAQLDEQPSFL